MFIAHQHLVHEPLLLLHSLLFLFHHRGFFHFLCFLLLLCLVEIREFVLILVDHSRNDLLPLLKGNLRILIFPGLLAVFVHLLFEDFLKFLFEGRI